MKNYDKIKFGNEAYPGSATELLSSQQRTDREPSSARSASNCEERLRLTGTFPPIRGRCEPRTARGPLAASGCAPPALFSFALAFFPTGCAVGPDYKSPPRAA